MKERLERIKQNINRGQITIDDIKWMAEMLDVYINEEEQKV